MNTGAKGLILFVVLTACAAAVTIRDAGCLTYGEARLSMPALGTDPLSQWVAVLDGRMTAVCR